MMKASGAANRVFDIIDRKPVMPPVVIRQDTEAGDADATPSRAIPASPPAVSFRDINFAYPLRADMSVLGPGFSLERRGRGAGTGGRLWKRKIDCRSTTDSAV